MSSLSHRLVLPLAFVALLGSVACSSSTAVPPAPASTPKVLVDKADRVAYDAVRAFQVGEELAYHTKPQLPWPSDQQHKDINAKVSQAYTLIIDVANIGILLPPGGKLSIADLGTIAQLSALVAQIVTDVKNPAAAAPPAVQALAVTAQTKADALVSSVQTQGGL